MPHYGTLRETNLQQDPDDLRGAEVYGVNDEKLGKVDDVIFDHSSGDIKYVVVETGGLFSKKSFLLPANRVSPYGNHDDKFYAELDKERIQMLPEYDENALKSEGNWSEYEKHYEDQWKDGALMYNTSTGRMITPPPEEIPRAPRGSKGTERSAMETRDFTPQRLGREDEPLGIGNSRSATLEPKKPSVAGRKDAILADWAATNISDREKAADARFDDSRSSAADRSMGERAKDKLRNMKEEVIARTARPGGLEGDVVAHREGLDRPGVYRGDAVPDEEKLSDMNEPLNANYGPRWNRFQSRLRERRDDVVAECPICGSQRKVA
jgi:sporulation protein YlmC with PRC-barrel domain